MHYFGIQVILIQKYFIDTSNFLNFLNLNALYFRIFGTFLQNILHRTKNVTIISMNRNECGLFMRNMSCNDEMYLRVISFSNMYFIFLFFLILNSKTAFCTKCITFNVPFHVFFPTTYSISLYYVLFLEIQILMFSKIGEFLITRKN